MYDPQIISANLSSLSPSVIIGQGKSGERELAFELQYHSPEQIAQMVDHLDSLINLDLYKSTCETNAVKIELKRQLTEDELIWIENERILSKYDCNYFMDGYYKYLSAEGEGWKQFSPLIPTKVNRRIRARLQKAKRAIRKWTVKARQQAESTDSQGVVLHRLNYYIDTISMIASFDSDSTSKLSDMFLKAMAQLPWWNRTFIDKLRTHEEYYFDNGSLFDLGWGTQEKLGRGRNPLVSHISEVPFFKAPRKSLEESLFNAMHENVWQLILVEGTAEERGDYYHQKTLEIIKGMSTGTTSFEICFHPWYARRDLFPAKTWLHTRAEAFAKWIPSSETIAHATKARNWVLNNKDYREEFGSNWYLSREQLFFYEIEKNAAIGLNSLQAFLKERPSDIEEAFQNAGQSLYPLQTIIHISDRAQGTVPQIYKLRGDPNEINPSLFPEVSEYDNSRQLIEIVARWDSSLPQFTYELVPIKFEGWDHFDSQNKVIIWEHPLPFATYGMGVDDSDGLGKDRSDDSVIEIIKKGTVEYPDKQVCEFASAELPPDRLRPFGLALATYYSQHKEQILITPETKRGFEFLNGLLNVGWINFFRPLDQARADKNLIESNRFGLVTSPRTRQELVNNMNAFIMGDFVEIYSMLLIQELKDLTKKRSISVILGEIHEKILAASGKSDNRFMAFGMCLYGLHRNEIMGLEQASWQKRLADQNAIITMKSFKGDFLDRIDLDNETESVYPYQEIEAGIDRIMQDIYADDGY